MIRQAAPDDIVRIKRLMQSESGCWHDTWPDDALEKAITASAGLSYVWDEAGQILGFVCVHDLGFRAYLSQIVVEEPARGRGIGTRLIERVQKDLTARECPLIIVDAWRDAVNFYRTLGWSEPDAVLLRKRLDG